MLAALVALLAIGATAAVIPPELTALAIALVVGAAIVFPVHDRYYPERQWAAAGSQVGLCDGVLPLSEFVQNRLADDRYARWYYVGGCND